MFEVEVKTYLSNTNRIIDILNNKGCIFETPIIQKDDVFVHKSIQNANIPNGSNVLRIRTENDMHLLTLKQMQNSFETIELETIIDNPDAVTEMLILLGYKRFVAINKKRIQSKYNNFLLCIDEVEYLGNFLEVELLVKKEEEKSAALEQIHYFLNELGISKNDICHERYHIMLYNKINGL
jgi:adenylate cyclase class 2